MLGAGAEFERHHVDVLPLQYRQMSEAEIAMPGARPGVLVRRVGGVVFEHTAIENSVFLSRRVALVPLARNVGYAFHVMVCCGANLSKFFGSGAF